MELPNADRAVIDASKVRDYLLSETHPVWRFKAALFRSLGYEAVRWEVLSDDLLALGRSGSATAGQPSAYGLKYEVDGSLTGPSGRSALFRSVWVVGADGTPRFVTAFPR